MQRKHQCSWEKCEGISKLLVAHDNSTAKWFLSFTLKISPAKHFLIPTEEKIEIISQKYQKKNHGQGNYYKIKHLIRLAYSCKVLIHDHHDGRQTDMVAIS